MSNVVLYEVKIEMMLKKEMLALYAVTDRTWEKEGYPLEKQLEDALKGGVTCVQLREKGVDDALFLSRARIVKEICAEFSVPLLINDRLDIALEVDADGVHLGQKDLSVLEAKAILKEKNVSMIVGATARTLEQAQLAEKQGADYLGSGAVFGTTTKLDAVPMSRETLMEICSGVTIPVVGIGGISSENLPKLQGTGISGVALVSTIFASADICETCKGLKEVVKKVIHT